MDRPCAWWGDRHVFIPGQRGNGQGKVQMDQIGKKEMTREN
uniref:Uncharacterized protein n=1 Tax=Rhizophora mucronata TaxID=61149 RepID=A0A2P2QUW7_RHIMU